MRSKCLRNTCTRINNYKVYFQNYRSSIRDTLVFFRNTLDTYEFSREAKFFHSDNWKVFAAKRRYSCYHVRNEKKHSFVKGDVSVFSCCIRQTDATGFFFLLNSAPKSKLRNAPFCGENEVRFRSICTRNHAFIDPSRGKYIFEARERRKKFSPKRGISIFYGEFFFFTLEKFWNSEPTPFRCRETVRLRIRSVAELMLRKF